MYARGIMTHHRTSKRNAGSWFSPVSHRRHIVQGYVVDPASYHGVAKPGMWSAEVAVEATGLAPIKGWTYRPGFGLSQDATIYDRRDDHARSRVIARGYAAIDKGLGIPVRTTTRKTAPGQYTITVSIKDGPSVTIRLQRADVSGRSGSREEWRFEMRNPPSRVSRDDNRSLAAALIIAIENAMAKSHRLKSTLTDTNFDALTSFMSSL